MSHRAVEDAASGSDAFGGSSTSSSDLDDDDDESSGPEEFPDYDDELNPKTSFTQSQDMLKRTKLRPEAREALRGMHAHSDLLRLVATRYAMDAFIAVRHALAHPAAPGKPQPPLPIATDPETGVTDVYHVDVQLASRAVLSGTPLTSELASVTLAGVLEGLFLDAREDIVQRIERASEAPRTGGGPGDAPPAKNKSRQLDARRRRAVCLAYLLRCASKARACSVEPYTRASDADTRATDGRCAVIEEPIALEYARTVRLTFVDTERTESGPGVVARVRAAAAKNVRSIGPIHANYAQIIESYVAFGSFGAVCTREAVAWYLLSTAGDPDAGAAAKEADAGAEQPPAAKKRKSAAPAKSRHAANLSTSKIERARLHELAASARLTWADANARAAHAMPLGTVVKLFVPARACTSLVKLFAEHGARLADACADSTAKSACNPWTDHVAPLFIKLVHDTLVRDAGPP